MFFYHYKCHLIFCIQIPGNRYWTKLMSPHGIRPRRDNGWYEIHGPGGGELETGHPSMWTCSVP